MAAAVLSAAGAAPTTTFPGVFKGRELTRKDRRLGASLEPVNAWLEGGIPRGRISEIVGRRSCGKTSLAAAFISNATRRGEVAAVIDMANAFDPATMAEAGVELSRVLWVQPDCGVTSFSRWSEKYAASGSEKVKGVLEEYQCPHPNPLPGQGEGTEGLYDMASAAFGNVGRTAKGWRGNTQVKNFLRAAELVLEAGGFGLLVMDFGESAYTLAQSSALRLARMAERSGTAVLMLATRPLCGTFAAMSLDLTPTRALFSRIPLRQALPELSTSDKKITRQGPGIKLSQHFKSIRWPHPDLHPQLKVGGETWSLPALFEGIEIKAIIRRNKIGRSGKSAQWRSLVNPSDPTLNSQAPRAVRIA
jgi:hypothetical protein